jgi:hypothetical protein
MMKARRKAKRANGAPNASTVAAMNVGGINANLGVATGLTPDPFPNRWRGKLSFAQVFYVGSNGSGGTTVALRFGDSTTRFLNSLYDPEGTTGTRQPQYFSTFAALYKRYKVHNVKLEIIAQTNYASPVVLGWRIEPPGGGSSIDNVNVQTGITLPYTAIIPLSGSGGQSIYRATKNISIAQICGLTPKELDANVEDYSALCTADPARIPTVEFGVANMINTSSAIVTVTMVMVFDAEMFDRIL